MAKLCCYLVLLRRQSDIIGQTARNEYRLLLQRPAHADEPAEVADYLIAGLILLAWIIPDRQFMLKFSGTISRPATL